MKIEQLKAFLAAVGVYNVNYTSGKWAQCSCPLAPFTHPSGKDSHPSCGVTVEEGRSNFHCYTCKSGTLAELIWYLEHYVKAEPKYAELYKLDKAKEILQHEEDGVTILPEYSELVPSPYQEFHEWPEYWLEDYPAWHERNASVQYLSQRNISKEAAEYFDLRVDESKNRLVCPIRTVSGKLAGARGRWMGPDDKGWLKHFDYAWNNWRNSHLIWYNEPALELPGPLVLVEGQFDAMRVWDHHRKVVSILSTKTTPYKRKKLTACECVVLMLDNDEPGQQRTEEWAKYLEGAGVRVGYVTDWPKEVKDAGEAPYDWLETTLFDLT